MVGDELVQQRFDAGLPGVALEEACGDLGAGASLWPGLADVGGELGQRRVGLAEHRAGGVDGVADERRRGDQVRGLDGGGAVEGGVDAGHPEAVGCGAGEELLDRSIFGAEAAELDVEPPPQVGGLVAEAELSERGALVQACPQVDRQALDQRRIGPVPAGRNWVWATKTGRNRL
ncbi:hypothetical protein ACFQ0O_00195 [Saccharopolyspora spinosporotrichia]